MDRQFSEENRSRASHRTKFGVGFTLVALAASLSGCNVVINNEEPKQADRNGNGSQQSRSQQPSQQTNGVAPTPRFVLCDRNISARQPGTTCPFASNVFYEYWVSGQSAAVSAYSPATRRFYDLTCNEVGSFVNCEAGDGAGVRFPTAAVDAYSDSQAREYARTHQINPGTGSQGTGGTQLRSPGDESSETKGQENKSRTRELSK